MANLDASGELRPVREVSPEAFGGLIRKDYDDMAKVVKAVGRIE